MHRLSFVPESYAGSLVQPSPLVWVLTGEKPGDNAQAFTLATALGWTTEVKQVRYLAPRSPRTTR